MPLTWVDWYQNEEVDHLNAYNYQETDPEVSNAGFLLFWGDQGFNDMLLKAIMATWEVLSQDKIQVGMDRISSLSMEFMSFLDSSVISNEVLHRVFEVAEERHHALKDILFLVGNPGDKDIENLHHNEDLQGEAIVVCT